MIIPAIIRLVINPQQPLIAISSETPAVNADLNKTTKQIFQYYTGSNLRCEKDVMNMKESVFPIGKEREMSVLVDHSS